MKKLIVSFLLAYFTINYSMANTLVGDHVVTTNTVATNILVGSVIEGSTDNSASGVFSHAEGYSTTASGSCSHAEGAETTASGMASHAEGAGTTASGYASHASGSSANATNDYTYVWSDGTALSSTTSNQFTVHAANGIRLLGGSIEGNGADLTNVTADVYLGTVSGSNITGTIQASQVGGGTLNSSVLPESGEWNTDEITFSGSGISNTVNSVVENTEYAQTVENGIVSLTPTIEPVQWLEEMSPTQWLDRLGGEGANLVESACLTFNGTDQYVALATNTPDINGKSYAISVWVNLAAMPSSTNNYWPIINKSPSGYSHGEGMYIATYGVGLRHINIGSSPSSSDVAFGCTISTNTWTHLVVSYDQSEKLASFYMNGVLEDATNLTMDAGLTSNWKIGYHSRYFHGSLVDLRIFTNTLTTTEVSNIYNREIEVSCGKVAGWWPLAENAGEVVYDVSGTGNHGVIINGTGTLTNMWATIQDKFHYNLLCGFSAQQGTGAKIPAFVDHSGNDVLGNPLTNPAGAWHNGAETKIKQSTNNIALKTADDGFDFWYDAFDIPQAKDYDQLVNNTSNLVFCNIANPDRKMDIRTYASPLAGDTLEQVESYANQMTFEAENGFVFEGGPLQGDGSGLTNLQVSSLQVNGMSLSYIAERVVYSNKVSSISSLTNLPATDSVVVYVDSYYEGSGYGGGLFYFDSVSTNAENSGTTFSPASGTGLWKRIYDPAEGVFVDWFGAIKGDSSTNAGSINIQAFEKAQQLVMEGQYDVALIRMSEGNYYISKPLVVNDYTTIVGVKNHRAYLSRIIACAEFSGDANFSETALIDDRSLPTGTNVYYGGSHLSYCDLIGAGIVDWGIIASRWNEDCGIDHFRILGTKKGGIWVSNESTKAQNWSINQGSIGTTTDINPFCGIYVDRPTSRCTIEKISTHPYGEITRTAVSTIVSSITNIATTNEWPQARYSLPSVGCIGFYIAGGISEIAIRDCHTEFFDIGYLIKGHNVVSIENSNHNTHDNESAGIVVDMENQYGGSSHVNSFVIYGDGIIITNTQSGTGRINPGIGRLPMYYYDAATSNELINWVAP